ncbi:acyloxyacyl hydrolase [Hydrogenophaga sp.]|uniref:acyloxyacyl hydrolase n=1 Tax=Hydrogenophaga sp. TaxID=1904254 RepID=UPI00286D91C7|nr:acyloxyacyl hydrolase [Hydrogenophaga sp.]
MKKIGLLICMLLFSGSVSAVDGVSVEHGNGDLADMVRVGALWNWNKQWSTEGDWLVTGFWEVSLGTWRGNSAAGNSQTIGEVGITPVFRLQQRNLSGLAPYAEGAFSFYLISPTFINANRKFGSSLQFSEHIGFGARFGDHHEFDLGYSFQHISNGGIKKPNHGINFREVRFAYHF